MEGLLRDHIARRKAATVRLTLFKNFVDKLSNDMDIGMIVGRVNANKRIVDQFDTAQSCIEELVSGTELEASHIHERKEFETSFFSAMAIADNYISRIKASAAVLSAPSSETTDPRSTFRPLTIMLPSFDGECGEWSRFRESFETLIHYNTLLSDSRRFQYLKSCLKDPPADLIELLETSHGNYKCAWDSLNKRYEEIRLSRVSYIVEPSEISPAQGQGPLKKFYDSTSNRTRELETSNQSAISCDTLISPSLLDNSETTRQEDKNRPVFNSNEKPKPRDFSDFLEQPAKLIERIPISGSDVESSNSNLRAKSLKRDSSRWAVQKNPSQVHSLDETAHRTNFEGALEEVTPVCNKLMKLDLESNGVSAADQGRRSSSSISLSHSSRPCNHRKARNSTPLRPSGRIERNVASIKSRRLARRLTRPCIVALSNSAIERTIGRDSSSPSLHRRRKETSAHAKNLVMKPDLYRYKEFIFSKGVRLKTSFKFTRASLATLHTSCQRRSN